MKNVLQHFGRQLGSDPAIIIAKRELSLGKSYVIFALFFASMAILAANFGNAFLRGVLGGRGTYATMSVSLVSVGLTALTALWLMTPVILLYVYDKNNGVLEYFLSLGLNQGDVYKRYLKAAVILVLLFVVVVAMGNVALALILKGDVTFPLEVAAFAAVVSLSIVSFVTMAMMAFSSLQRQRAGANQPLGLALGALLVMPTYLAPWLLPFVAVVALDLAEAIAIAVLAMLLFLLSGRLISREKLLP